MLDLYVHYLKAYMSCLGSPDRKVSIPDSKCNVQIMAAMALGAFDATHNKQPGSRAIVEDTLDQMNARRS